MNDKIIELLQKTLSKLEHYTVAYDMLYDEHKAQNKLSDLEMINESFSTFDIQETLKDIDTLKEVINQYDFQKEVDKEIERRKKNEYDTLHFIGAPEKSFGQELEDLMNENQDLKNFTIIN
jgi:hypothetical protein